jgi:isoleucyl-tRNA synthetase
VLQDGSDTIALDLTLTPELAAAGLARDVIRLVQDARKASGFDVSDRIELTWHCDDSDAGEAAAAAIRDQRALIAREVLATAMTEASLDGPFAEASMGLCFRVVKAS